MCVVQLEDDQGIVCAARLSMFDLLHAHENKHSILFNDEARNKCSTTLADFDVRADPDQSNPIVQPGPAVDFLNVAFPAAVLSACALLIIDLGYLLLFVFSLIQPFRFLACVYCLFENDKAWKLRLQIQGYALAEIAQHYFSEVLPALGVYGNSCLKQIQTSYTYKHWYFWSTPASDFYNSVRDGYLHDQFLDPFLSTVGLAMTLAKATPVRLSKSNKPATTGTAVKTEGKDMGTDKAYVLDSSKEGTGELSRSATPRYIYA